MYSDYKTEIRIKLAAANNWEIIPNSERLTI